MAKKKTSDELSPAFKISFAMQKTSARLLRFSKIMVSISGGADSDVMLDLLLKVCPKEKMTFVFFDTGIEYSATKRHLDYLEKKYDIIIDRQRADVPVPLGVKKYGLPFISKMISGKLQILQNNNVDFANDGNLSYEELQEKYPHCKQVFKWWCNKAAPKYCIERNYKLKEFLITYPPTFKISDKCCNGAKKQPSHKYEKSHNFECKCMGLRRAEGGIRSTTYKNCYTYDPAAPIQNMRPIWWLTDADKAEYINTYGVVLSDCYIVYGMRRTGCAGCPFNSQFETDLQILRTYEPKLYRAAGAIFGASYEYTRKYREFKENERRKEHIGGQQSIFDYIHGGDEQ